MLSALNMGQGSGHRAAYTPVLFIYTSSNSSKQVLIFYIDVFFQIDLKADTSKKCINNTGNM